MIDALSEAIRLMQGRAPAAVPMLFGAGLVTSVGPCVAPRYVALAALAGRTRRPWLTAATFAFGIIAAYVVIGLCAGTLAQLRAWATPIDVIFATVLAAAGVLTLLRDDTHAQVCGDAHDRARDCGSIAATPRRWTVACMGAASALVISPCCTPVVAAIASVAQFGARPLEGAILVVAFAAGHVLPLGFAVAAPAALPAVVRSPFAAHAGTVISGTLLLALAAFYAVLA